MGNAFAVALWEGNFDGSTIASVSAIDLGTIEQHRAHGGSAEVDIEVLMV